LSTSGQTHCGAICTWDRALDAASGEPTLIQNIDTQGYGTRTSSIYPSGGLLIAGKYDVEPEVKRSSGQE